MNIGEEQDPIEVPMPVHPSKITREAPAPAPQPAQPVTAPEPQKVPA
jgi:hypothetical protein